jgi:exonuclease VII small subunit
VREGTASVLDRITLQQDTLRQLLTRAYGDTGRLPATEVDPVVDLLAGTVAAQDEALASLARGAVVWPRANTALHTAAGRMQQALDALRSLQPPTTDDEDDTMASRNVGDYDEHIDGLDSESQDNRSQPVSPGDFQEALSLRSLPIPDYTSAEIMAEEAANQQKRARRKAVRAGAKVEKNW